MKTLIVIILTLLTVPAFCQTAVSFKKVIPDGYDPSDQVSKFYEYSQNITMPPGHAYVKGPVKQGQTWAGMFTKGVTHYERHSIKSNDVLIQMRASLPDKEYNGVPTTLEIFNLGGCASEPDIIVDGYSLKCWPNGPFNETQARAKADDIWNSGSASNLWIGETMEQRPYMPPTTPMWAWFYDELAAKYEAKKQLDGKPYFLCHNYFSVEGPNLFASREQNESYYNTPTTTWPSTFYHPGAPLSKTNTVMEGIYLNAVDLLPRQATTALFRMELWAKLGKFTGIFLQSFHEWEGIFQDRVDFPEGSLYRSGKPVLDPNFQILMAFLAHEYGQIFVDYGYASAASPPNKKPVEYYPPIHSHTDTWRPLPGQSSTFQSYFVTDAGQNADYYSFLAAAFDYTHFGNLLWMQTGGQVASGTPYYCSYKIDNGSWNDRKSNGSDLIQAYYDQRGVARCRIQGNKMVLYYFNLFADNLKHNIEIKHPNDPSRTFIGSVAGTGIHVVVVDL